MLQLNLFGNKPLYKELHAVNKTADFRIQSIINAKNLSGHTGILPDWTLKNGAFPILPFNPSKGQLISKCPLGVIVSTKIPTKKFDNFCPGIWKVVNL